MSTCARPSGDVQAIEADSRFKNARKLEERADRRERDEAVRARPHADPPVRARITPLVAELRAQLNLDSLVKASRGEGYEAHRRRRSLALVRIQLSTLARELQDRHDVRAEISFRRSSIRSSSGFPRSLVLPPVLFHQRTTRSFSIEHSSIRTHERDIRRPRLRMRERLVNPAAKSVRRPSRRGSSR